VAGVRLSVGVDEEFEVGGCPVAGAGEAARAGHLPGVSGGHTVMAGGGSESCGVREMHHGALLPSSTGTVVWRVTQVSTYRGASEGPQSVRDVRIRQSHDPGSAQADAS
jgi:hypothetical protein